jgi:hypothetical protein
MPVIGFVNVAKMQMKASSPIGPGSNVRGNIGRIGIETVTAPWLFLVLNRSNIALT